MGEVVTVKPSPDRVESRRLSLIAHKTGKDERAFGTRRRKALLAITSAARKEPTARTERVDTVALDYTEVPVAHWVILKAQVPQANHLLTKAQVT